MGYVMDFWHAIVTAITSLDAISLGIMAVVVIAAGLIMEDFAALITTTIVALVLFGVAGYVRTIAMGHGASAGTVAADHWHQFLATPMQTMLVYAVIFAVGISIVSVIKQIVASR